MSKKLFKCVLVFPTPQSKFLWVARPFAALVYACSRSGQQQWKSVPEDGQLEQSNAQSPAAHCQ